MLGAADFTGVGWSDVKLDSLANGDPQFLYACQRRSLAQTRFPISTISATWTRQKYLSAAENVAELTSPPQARELFVELTQWYEHCTHIADGFGPPTASTRLDTVRTEHGVAQIWRVVRGSHTQRPTYSILARDDYRVGLIDLYSDLTPPDPTGLRSLARSAVDHLG